MSWQHIVVKQFGGPEQLELVTEKALPEPGAGQVRVRVLAAGTGFTDTIIRQGQYLDIKQQPPLTLGYDWFGVVDKLGPGVTGLQVGQRVGDMPGIGGYTQYLCVDAGQVVPAPDGVDPAEAVCMMLSYTTAYQMLTRLRNIPAGSKCLVHAAGGAVGTALLELGRLMGLEMYGTASESKKSLVESLGATHIDYRKEDVVERTLSDSQGGVDVVFDTLGGQSWARSYRCLKRGGLLIGFGAMQVTTGEESSRSVMWGFAKLLLLWKLLPDGKHSTFYNIFNRRKKLPQEFKEDVQALFKLLQEGTLHPAVAERVPLSQAAEVHRRIDQAQVPGKIVLICNEE